MTSAPISVRRSPRPLIASSKDHVLVVSSSRTLAKTLATRCNALDGVVAEVAESHAEAIDLLRSGSDRFCAAVVDLVHPDAPHGAVLELVREYGIPGIVFTAHQGPSVRQDVFGMGAVDYVHTNDPAGIRYVCRIIERLADPEPGRVLIVDDSRSFRTYAEKLLRQHGYQTVTASDGLGGLDCMHRHPDISMVITDYHMPNMDGLKMTAELRRRWSYEELSIIAASDSENPTLLSQFLRGGATDYLHKWCPVEELFCRVDQNYQTLQSIRRARDAAYRDCLTRLDNRRSFFTQAPTLHREALAGETDLLLAMVDVDHFKSINDRFGHDAGDSVLVALASVLAEQAASPGIAARLGGEEFVCVWPITGYEEVSDAERLEGLRKAISSVACAHEGEVIPVTASIGATRRLGASIDDMIMIADGALYEAKNTGRNRVVVAERIPQLLAS